MRGDFKWIILNHRRTLPGKAYNPTLHPESLQEVRKIEFLLPGGFILTRAMHNIPGLAFGIQYAHGMSYVYPPFSLRHKQYEESPSYKMQRMGRGVCGHVMYTMWIFLETSSRALLIYFSGSY